MSLSGQVFSYQKGRFPVQASDGSNYILVVYDYDSNSILFHPIKSRSGKDFTLAYTKIYDLLEFKGLNPQLQLLDNELPPELEQFLNQKGVNFQLVPPHVHRRNSTEHAIRTFKDKFHCGTVFDRSKLPHSVVVEIVGTIYANNQLTETIQDQSESLSIHSVVWKF